MTHDLWDHARQTSQPPICAHHRLQKSHHNYRNHLTGGRVDSPRVRTVETRAPQDSGRMCCLVEGSAGHLSQCTPLEEPDRRAQAIFLLAASQRAGRLVINSAASRPTHERGCACTSGMGTQTSHSGVSAAKEHTLARPCANASCMCGILCDRGTDLEKTCVDCNGAGCHKQSGWK